MKIKPTRREFFSVAAIGTATALANRPATARIQEAKVVAGDDPVRIAVIGINGQGNSLAKSMAGQPGARLDVLCDVDSAVLARRKKEFADRGVATRAVGDPRQVFDDDSIDAVVIATPNHLHSILSVMALEAGKHVYVEKPVSHVVKEGRAIVDGRRGNGPRLPNGNTRSFVNGDSPSDRICPARRHRQDFVFAWVVLQASKVDWHGVRPSVRAVND